MFGWEITWGQPWFCALLLLVPLLWWFSFQSLAGLGKWRRILALALRTLVYAGIVMALAEVQIRRTSEKLTVIYLLDQSESIPPDKRTLMLDYVVREVATHRNASRGDRAGVIVFGREALIEIPPFADDLPSVGQIESQRELHTDATNLAAALKLGQASFPEDGAKRIVVVTDGNENLGNARSLAPLLREQGIGLDVLGVELGDRGEVAVEKVVLPSNTRRGQPLETRIVVQNFGAQPVAGTLTLTRRLGASENLLSESTVLLKPGKNVYTVRETEIASAGIFSYIATFDPANATDDRLSENNLASGFTYVRGRGRVLLIEDWENRGEFDYLVTRLRENELEVDVMPSNQLFSSLAELQAYDVVVLANVPRSSGDPSNNVTNFSDDQIRMLVHNTEHMGCGLIMLGGRNSFGAGGWSNTELEKAMPVDFQIENKRINAVGALVLIMHASEIAQGNYWQKVIGMEALKALGPMDQCGVVQWNDSTGSEQWLWGEPSGMLVASSSNRRLMTSRLNRMAPGDMPFFEPGMQMALNALKGTNAAMKHVILISDGDAGDPSPSIVQAFAQAKIKISTVAVGAHGPAESSRLQMIADATGGNYYEASNPRMLPRIYQREARRVAQPLIREPENGVRPHIVLDHELHGLPTSTPLPPIFGFVMTTKKEVGLVEVSILSPDPPDSPQNGTILASWTYGLGRAVAFTTDTGHRWANQWTGWPQYDKFFSQMVRWAMRPVDDGSKFTVATEFREGKVRVVVNALQSGDNFLNLDQLLGTAIGPDMQPFPVRIDQVAPGRYVGEFSADKPGSYYLTVNTGVEQVEVDGRTEQRSRAPLITGVTVPYSPEFNDRESNLALLKYLAAVLPKGGEAGTVISEDLRPELMENLIRQVDTFRHNLAKAVSVQDIWPLVLLVVAGVFFADVLVRRLALDWEWVTRLRAAVIRRFGGNVAETEEKESRLEQLRSRKAAVSEQLDERRAAARFEPEADAPLDAQQILQEAAGGDAAGPRERPRSQPSLTPEATSEQESYTARLLKAKQHARKDGQK
jgi:uncharacterized membrane protein